MSIDEEVKKLGEILGKEVTIAIKQAQALELLKNVHTLTKGLYEAFPNMTVSGYLHILEELINDPKKLRKVIELDF